jgi:hypothetical protein
MDSLTTVAGWSMSRRLTDSGVFIRSALRITLFIYHLIHIGACSAAQPAGGQTVSFTFIDQGSQSRVRKRKSLVIKSAEEWENLLQTYRRPHDSVQSGAPIDFDREMVIAVFMDEKPSGGYGIAITGITARYEKQQLRITIRERNPPPNVFSTQALTQPYHIIKLAKIELPIVFSSP